MSDTPHDESVENVTPRRFQQLTGFSPKAVYGKIARGDWLEGYEFHRSETGALTVYLPGYRRWAQGLPRVAHQGAGVLGDQSQLVRAPRITGVRGTPPTERYSWATTGIKHDPVGSLVLAPDGASSVERYSWTTTGMKRDPSGSWVLASDGKTTAQQDAPARRRERRA